MTDVKLAALVALAIAAGGCATDRVGGQNAEEVKGYCAERFADKRIDPVRGKILVPLTIGEAQPIEMLANRSVPGSEEERKAVLALAEAHASCNKLTSERLGPPPSYRLASQDAVTLALSDLYAGDITYGGFAKRMLFIGSRDQAEREDLEQAIKAHERWSKELDLTN